MSQIIFFTTILWDYSQPALVSMLDVGQGDSFLIETKLKHRILVDTGPHKSELMSKIKSHLSYFDNRVDVVFISHFDSDHVGQLKEIIQKYKPELVVLPAYDFGKNKLHDIYTENNFQTSASGTTFMQLLDGDRVVFGGNIIDVVYPRMIDYVDSKNNNETSLVFIIRQKNIPSQKNCMEKSILFTGDIGSQAERRIVSRTTTGLNSSIKNLNADILKIAHHGSRYSSTKSFIEKVGASEVLVSYGKKNNYGHPNKKVLDSIESLGAKVFMSGELGDVSLSLCK